MSTQINGLPIWVIYHDPDDYPGKYVVRRQVAREGTIEIDAEPSGVVDTLGEARALVPPGCYRLARDGRDSPSILESWL